MQVRVARIAALRSVAYTLVTLLMFMVAIVVMVAIVIMVAIVVMVAIMFTIVPVVITIAKWRRRRLRCATGGDAGASHGH